MNTKSPIGIALVASAALLFGCQDRPTAPLEDGPQGPLLAKGGNKGGQESTQTVTFVFRDAKTETGAPEDRIYGDERVPFPAGGTAYTGDACGVVAMLPGYSNAYLRTNTDKIKRNEESNCGGSTERRYFTVDFRGARSDNGDPLEWDDQPMDAKWMDLVYIQIRNIELNASDYGKLRIVFKSDGSERSQGFGDACPASLVFDKDEWPGTSDVLVKRVKERQSPDDYDEWTIEPGPGDVAVCLGGTNDPVPLGYYHLPFQVNVVCRGENCGPT